jgi:hypothetical protein
VEDYTLSSASISGLVEDIEYHQRGLKTLADMLSGIREGDLRGVPYLGQGLGVLLRSYLESENRCIEKSIERLRRYEASLKNLAQSDE